MQEKMLSYQRECQRRASEQVRADMARFKERELAALRLDSEDRLQEEVRKSRREFEAFYQERQKALQQRERNMMDGMKKRETELDATLYAQRQKILDELEAVKNRELQLRRQFETEERGVLGERERLRNLEQDLNLREMTLQNVNKLKDTEQSEVLTVKKVQLEREYDEKRKSIEIQEATLREERRSLSQLEGICSQQMKEASELRTQLYRLQEAVRLSTEAQFCAEREKQDVIQRVEKMGDYSMLKSENIRLENEVYSIRREVDKQTVIHEERVKDYESRLTDLRMKLRQPSEEVHEMRNKLLHGKQILERERVLNENVSKQLELRLETSEQQQHCLKDALRDHQDLVKQLTQELTELKIRTGNISKRSRPGRESLESQPLKSSLRPLSAQSAPPQLLPEHPDPLPKQKSARVRIRLPPTPDSTLNETADVSHSLSEISFVQEAKSSLERLEREAQELEQSYKNVHHRILRGATMDDPIQSILTQYQQPFTSTIDPRKILQKFEVLPDKLVPTASLTSLSDLNLTAGVNESQNSDSEKFTDLLSSCTPFDTVPILTPRNLDIDTDKYLSTITEPLENALETSILGENFEQNDSMNQVSESKKISIINTSEIHTLDASTHSDASVPVSDVEETPLITFEPTNSSQTLAVITTPSRVDGYSSITPGATDRVMSGSGGTVESTEVIKPLSSPFLSSEHEREREEAIKQVLQEEERIRMLESDLQPDGKISDTDMVPVQMNKHENSGEISVETAALIPDTDVSLAQSETQHISNPAMVSAQIENPVKSVGTEESVGQINPMVMYMELLNKKSTTEKEEVSEVSGGYDGSVKSEEVSVSIAGFSETDQTDPFAEW